MCIRAIRCSDGVQTTFYDVFDAFDGGFAFMHRRCSAGVKTMFGDVYMRLMNDVHSCTKVLGWC